jgi:tetratricopeptide (TPR) repeat protein
MGKGPEAEQQFRQALVLQERLAVEFPAVPEYRLDLALSHLNLGTLLRDQGKGPEAEEHFRQALALQEKLATDFPAVPEYSQELATSHHNLGYLLAGLGKRVEAEQHFRQALALREKLAAEFRDVLKYQVDLGGSLGHFGFLVSASGRPSDSLVWFDKAIRTLSAVYERDRRLLVARQYLRNSHQGRATAYDRLRRYAEALPDWDRAIELSPPQEQPGFRAVRATTRVNAGLVAEAVAEVAALTQMAHWNAGQWYDFACVYALASGKNTNKKQEYADRAVELLHQAVKAGWKDAAHMKKDTDLDSLRGREDFQKLLRELEKKSSAGAEKQP